MVGEFRRAVEASKDSYIPRLSARSVPARLKRARCLSNSASEVVRVFATVPSGFTATQSAPAVWRTMVDLRLSNAVFSGTQPCPLYADAQQQNSQNERRRQTESSTQGSTQQEGTVSLLDTYGYHASTCSCGLGSTARHNRIRNLINVLLRASSIGLLPHAEWTFPQQEHLPWKKRKRLDLVIDDVSFLSERQGYDVTVVSPRNKNYTKDAAARAAGACIIAEDKKIQKYRDLCERDRITFTPVGMDIHGALGSHAKMAFRQLAQYAAAQRGTAPHDEYSRLTLRVVTKALQLTASAVNRRRRRLSQDRAATSCEIQCVVPCSPQNN